MAEHYRWWWNPGVNARTELEEFAKGYKLLTAGMRGIIEVANIYYEHAKYRWGVLEELAPIGTIKRKLKRGNPLLGPEISVIQAALSVFAKYFEERKELERERIDLNLLYARVYVTQLRYFMHQHYFNKKEAKGSEKELLGANNIYKALGEEINTVKQVNDFNYKYLRDLNDFITVDEHFYQKQLRVISEIP